MFAWPDFEPDNLFADLTVSRLALAEHLASRGIDICMTWVGATGDAGEGRLREWVAARAGGMAVEVAPLACKMHYPWRLRWERAFDFHVWLKGYAARHRVDSVNLSDGGGVAYYALLAKRGGLAYADIRFVIEASGPLRRLKALNHQPIDNLGDLYQDFLERRCIEMADNLIAPDPMIADWMTAHQWRMPSAITAIEPVSGALADVRASKRLARVVFIMPMGPGGRLLRVCRILDQDAVKARLRDIEVVFWGAAEEADRKMAIAHLESCSKSWPFRWRVEEDLTERGIRSLFADATAAAILPLGRGVAWLPYQWCQDSGVPCIEVRAGNGPSTRTHADAADLAKLEEVSGPEAIERAIHDALDGAPILPAPGTKAAERIDARARLLLDRPTVDPPPTSAADSPLVSVCIVTRNRASLLPQALASIEAQDYPNIEIVLVDDGSTTKESQALLDDMEPRFLKKGWKMLRQGERTFHAAARNRAVREARGSWILLLDDDCVAEPHQVQTMVRYADRIGAVIVTCPRHVFTGDHTPGIGDRSGFVWVPLGSVPAAGLFENCLGDTNMLIRRDIFLGLDGLRTDFGVPSADREFLIRACTAGIRLEVVPEVLYHYRVTASSVSRGLMRDTMALRDLRFARPFVEVLPPTLADLPNLAAGWMRRAHQLEKDLSRAQARVERLEASRQTGRGLRREFHIQFTRRALRRWLLKLIESFRKRLPADPPEP